MSFGKFGPSGLAKRGWLRYNDTYNEYQYGLRRGGDADGTKATVGLHFAVSGAVCRCHLVLHRFTVPPRDAVTYLSVENAVLTDGTQEPADVDEFGQPRPKLGGLYRFTAILPDDLYGCQLLVFVSGLELTITLDGEELYCSAAAVPEVGQEQVMLPLPEGAAGHELTFLCRVLEENIIFPPLLRVTNDALAEADAFAYSNRTGIPARVYAFAFLLVCGLFLLGLSWKKPDWSFIPLVLASAMLVVRPRPGRPGGGSRRWRWSRRSFPSRKPTCTAL